MAIKQGVAFRKSEHIEMENSMCFNCINAALLGINYYFTPSNVMIKLVTV